MLSGNKIREEVYNEWIVIDPFNLEQLNPNSYNVRLGNQLKWIDDVKIDLHRLPTLHEATIPSEGYLLLKGNVYLASTVEVIGSKHYVPVIDGRSTTGRYGLAVHMTAGFGDVGFCGTFTLELEARHRDTLVRPGDLIAQVSFHEITGLITPYDGAYQYQTVPRGPKPLSPKFIKLREDVPFE